MGHKINMLDDVNFNTVDKKIIIKDDQNVEHSYIYKSNYYLLQIKKNGGKYEIEVETKNATHITNASHSITYKGIQNSIAITTDLSDDGAISIKIIGVGDDRIQRHSFDESEHKKILIHSVNNNEDTVYIF